MKRFPAPERSGNTSARGKSVPAATCGRWHKYCSAYGGGKFIKGGEIESMKKIMIAIFVLAAAASRAQAEGISLDFDGRKSDVTGFAEMLKSVDSCQNDKIACAPAPERIVAETSTGGELDFDALAAGIIGAPVVYGKDGARRDDVKIRRIIKAKVGKSEFQWVVGTDEQVYAVGMVRSMPEFETAQKMYLADALALFENAEAVRANKDSCKESHTSNCTAGEKYYCTHTICYRCWLEWVELPNGQVVQKQVCGSQTDSIDCEPTGIPCK